MHALKLLLHATSLIGATALVGLVPRPGLRRHGLVHPRAARPSLLQASGAAARLLREAVVELPPEAVVAAVEAARSRGVTRLTAADLAAEGSLDLETARQGLASLATALAGADGLSVAASNRGDLVYTYPADVRATLSARSSAAKAREAWAAASPALATVGRAAFGLSLFVSLAVIFAAITVIMSESSESGSGSRRRGGGWVGGDGGGGGGGGSGYGFTPFDLLWPRRYGFYGFGWFEPPPKMSLSLPEAIFSFVFGDGDPNVVLRAARLRALAGVIRSKGGAVVAEELAPYLDPPDGSTPSRSPLVDESWVVPALHELGGVAEVAEADDGADGAEAAGTIVYTFDDMRVTAIASDADLLLADPALADLDALDAPALKELAKARGVRSSGSEASLRAALRAWASDRISSSNSASGGSAELFPAGFLEERRAPFSNAESGQLFAAGALACLNLVGCAFLGNLLASIPAGAPLPEDLAWLGAVQTLYPALALYAVAFVAAPAVRYVLLQRRNAEVDRRNEARRSWRDALDRGGSELSKRLAVARRRGSSLRVVRPDDVAYDSAKPWQEQAEQPDFDDFDKRLFGD